MPTILLPEQVTTDTMRKTIIEFRQYVDSLSEGGELDIDLRTMTFIEPSGVISLSNIVQWSRQHKSINVNFLIDSKATSKNLKAMHYLSDCGFFANFGEEKVFKEPKLRRTMLALKTLETNHLNQWRQSDLMVWLQRQTGRSNDFSAICVAIDEIFNNIADHSTENIGSIFGQYYPKNHEIVIAISDFGIGIPSSLKNKFSGEKTDDEWIIEALKEGVSTQSVPQNRGAGLANIIRALTTNGVGSVTIMSNCGKVILKNNEIVDALTFDESYQGTFFELRIDTSNPALYDSEEEEDFVW